MKFSFSFVLRVEGREHSIHLTPEIGRKPFKTLFLRAFQRYGVYHKKRKKSIVVQDLSKMGILSFILKVIMMRIWAFQENPVINGIT